MFEAIVHIALQVVHHPTVLAAYGEGRQWTFEGDAEVKSKFWGRSIELTPVGILKLTFHDGEIFSWSKVCAPSPPSQLSVNSCTSLMLPCAQKLEQSTSQACAAALQVTSSCVAPPADQGIMRVFVARRWCPASTT